MSPGGHLVTTAVACAAVQASTGSVALTAGVAAGGFLIDLDHVFDYVLFERQRDLRPAAFLRYYLAGRPRLVVLLLHGYEVLALLALAAWLTDLTCLWGYVLGARSGLVTKQQTLDALAMTAATYSLGRPGRQWRTVEDTTNDPIITGRRPIPWTSWQRSEDYYSEGQLIWLDVDTLIREKTGGKKSLDDFARSFFGGHDGSCVQA